MKVALCLFGQPRFLENLNIYNAFKKFIYSQAEVDVFSHVWFNPEMKTFDQSDWSYSTGLKVHSKTPEIIQTIYNPKLMMCEKQINFAPSEETTKIVNSLPEQRFNNSKNISNVLSQLYSIKRTLDLVTQATTIDKSKYDFVLLTRYDVLVRSFPTLSQLERNKLYIGGYDNVGGSFPGFNDYIQIFDQGLINGFDAYTDFNKHLSQTQSLCIEEIKQIKFKTTFDYVSSVRYIGQKLLSEIARFPNFE